MSSNFGERIKISIFGQSHSEAIGVVIDGLPAGEEITIDLPNQVIKSSAGEFSFKIDSEWKRKLVLGLDDIGTTLQYEELISAYEKNRPSYWQ